MRPSPAVRGPCAAGGVLHDVAEDTDVTIEQVADEFGSNIALLVDGVTKISELKMQGFERQQAENFRKMLLSMVKDIRVILIKFADRLHNMRTLEFLAEKKRQRIALETREVYAPLAHRLGLAKIKWELEDLALKYLEPDVYFDLYTKIRETRQSRENTIQQVTRPIRQSLVEGNIHARFEGRRDRCPRGARCRCPHRAAGCRRRQGYHRHKAR